METFPAATREIRESILKRLQTCKVFEGVEPKPGVTLGQVGRVLVDEIASRTIQAVTMEREMEKLDKDIEGLERDLAKIEAVAPALLSADGLQRSAEFRQKYAKGRRLLTHLKEQSIIRQNRLDRFFDYLMLSCAGVLRRLTEGDWTLPLGRVLKAMQSEKRPGRPPKPGEPQKIEDREASSAERRVETVGGVRLADLEAVLILSKYPDLRKWRVDFTMFDRSDGWHFLLLSEHTRGREIPTRYRKVNTATAEKRLLGHPHPQPKYVPPFRGLIESCAYKSESGKEQLPPVYAFHP